MPFGDHVNTSPLSEDPQRHGQAGPAVTQFMSGRSTEAINLGTIFQLLQETSRTQGLAMKTLQDRLCTQETALKILQESVASLTRANDSLQTSRERANDPGNKSQWYSRLPKIRISLANNEEHALLRQQSYDRFLERVHGFGPPFDSINAYNVIQTDERRCLELYTIDLLAFEKLNQQETLESLVSKLDLSEDSIPQLGDYVVWIQVYAPHETHRSQMSKISREHQDHIMSWKTTTGLPISKTSYRNGKLLWHFNTISAAASACGVYLSLSGLIGRAIPHDLRALPIFCHHCGRPGHMKIQGRDKCKLPPQSKPPNYQENSTNSPCLTCAMQHVKNPPSQKCNRQPRCLNCGGNHGTNWDRCEDSDVEKHRMEWKKWEKGAWWAQHLDLPEVPRFPERKPKLPKKSGKKTQQTSPEEGYMHTWPSQPGIQLNPDGANGGVIQGNTDSGRPMTPIEVNDDGNLVPSPSDTPKAPSGTDAEEWHTLMKKKTEEAKKQAEKRAEKRVKKQVKKKVEKPAELKPGTKRPRGRPRKNDAQASPKSPQGSPSKRPRRQCTIPRSQSQGPESTDPYDTDRSYEDLFREISASAPVQSTDSISQSSRANTPWSERIPENAAASLTEVTAASQSQSPRDAKVDKDKGKAVCAAIPKLSQTVTGTSAETVPSVHVCDDDDDESDWEDEDEDE
ncbi:hypothetical protein HBI34_206280 [Parastagonospora nodorum]|nr:hypothetical protein HBI34_206280 [Parastagonospora nodorum]